MRDALRTCLQIAGGLTEATRRRAVGAAKELLDQTGIDVDAVQRSIGERIPPEVQTLADELMASGRANRDLLVGLIREEIDKAMSRVGRLADEVTKVGVVLEALERRIRNLEDDDREPAWADAADEEPDPGLYVPPQPPVEHAPVDGHTSAPAPARRPERTGATGATPVARKNAAPAHPPTTPEASVAPAAPEPVRTEGAGAVPVARKNAAPAKAPAPKKAAPAARKTAPAKKAAPAKTTAPAKKAAASGTDSAAKKATPARKTTAAAKKTAAVAPAKKAAPAAKKATPATPAKKTAAASRTAAAAPAKKTPAAKAPAKKAAPAEKATPAKKAATARKAAARPQEAKGRD
ncbi:histone [Actinacidiphila glaucinigra]|uniref:histone n=1 Tax=Actinacidiphila glaucinigra TaxID=235986 RepID=UPI002DD8B3D9|nr:histone [Actinacidiphila glaucinigra]WSD62895.1 histone [Actinacidiphila glaucinigra]